MRPVSASRPLAAGTGVKRAAEVNLATLRVAHAALHTRRRRFQRILIWSEPPKVFRQRAGDAERPLVQCGGDRQRARQQPRAVGAPGDRDIGARARPGIADQYFAIVEPLELFRAGKLTRRTDGLHLSPQVDRKRGEVAHLRCCSSRGQTGHASTQRLFKIGDQILLVLDPDRQADDIGPGTGLDLGGIVELAVRGGSRMDHQ
jgi:hypothetical protein